MAERFETTPAAGWMPTWTLSMTDPRTGVGAGRTAGAPPDLTEADDGALVAAFRAGRREAFDVIVSRHGRAVYRLCYRFVGNHEDASDLAQDVFVRAFKGLARFRGQASVGTWLHRVTVNAALNRRALRRPPVESIADRQVVDGRAVDPLQAIVADERARALRQAVHQLPPRQRAAIVLRVYEELSHEQIARILGSTVGAVKTNVFHAVANLKRLVRS